MDREQSPPGCMTPVMAMYIDGGSVGNSMRESITVARAEMVSIRVCAGVEGPLAAEVFAMLVFMLVAICILCLFVLTWAITM